MPEDEMFGLACLYGDTMRAKLYSEEEEENNLSTFVSRLPLFPYVHF